MDVIISRVMSLAAIDSLLEQFTPCLKSLSSGKVSRTALAEKFFRYGVVLEMTIGKNAVAFAGFYCNDTITHCGYLSMLAVMPQYEGKGHGKKMVYEVLRHAKNAGMRELKLEVNKSNHSAISFYKKMGFCFLPEETSETYFMNVKLHQSQ